MIQEKELRSGNWLYDICGTPSKYSFEWHKHYFDIDYKDIFDNINPNPITPEILEKCGFEGRFIEIKETPFYFYCDDNREVYLWCEIEGAKPYKHIRIISVHQLQNLYFALTGEELNIEL